MAIQPGDCDVETQRHQLPYQLLSWSVLRIQRINMSYRVTIMKNLSRKAQNAEQPRSRRRAFLRTGVAWLGLMLIPSLVLAQTVSFGPRTDFPLGAISPVDIAV